MIDRTVRPAGGTRMDWWMWVLLVLVILAALAGLVLYVQARRRSGGVISGGPGRRGRRS